MFGCWARAVHGMGDRARSVLRSLPGSAAVGVPCDPCFHKKFLTLALIGNIGNSCKGRAVWLSCLFQGKTSTGCVPVGWGWVLWISGDNYSPFPSGPWDAE